MAKALRPELEPLLTAKETCEWAGICTATLYRWLADPDLGLRDITMRLPGGQLRFPANQFRAWLEAV